MTGFPQGGDICLKHRHGKLKIGGTIYKMDTLVSLSGFGGPSNQVTSNTIVEFTHFGQGCWASNSWLLQFMACTAMEVSNSLDDLGTIPLLFQYQL